MLTRNPHPVVDNEALYRSHADELTAFASSLVGPQGAADAVSAAVLAVFSSPAWAEVTNRRAYLYRSVYNECIRVSERDQLRRERERQASAQESAVQLPLDHELTGLSSEVGDAVRALSTQQRAAIVLTYWQDLAVADVADHMGISEGSVRKHLARARAHLRSVLDD